MKKILLFLILLAGINLYGQDLTKTNLKQMVDKINLKLDTTKFHSGGGSGAITLVGGDAITLTTTNTTGVTLPTSGTLGTTTQINAKLDTTKFHTGGSTGAITLSGNDAITFTTTGATNVTLPTSGTLAPTANPVFTGVQKVSTTDTLSTKAYARLVGGGAGASAAALHAVSDSSNMDFYFIAATDASAREKLIADVVCDGTADQVQINAAITAGYNVKLSSGTFTIAAAITAAVNNLTIVGAGRQKTTISLDGNIVGITIGGNYWTIKDLKIDGEASTSSGINGENKTYCTIDNIEITDFAASTIRIFEVSTGWIIQNCYIHDTSYGGIEAVNWGAGNPSHAKIINCEFYNISTESHILIQADNSSDTLQNWVIDRCKFTGTTGYMAVLVSKAHNVHITNCFFDVDSAAGTENPANVRYYSGADNGVIANNTFLGSGYGVASSEGFTNIDIWSSKNIKIIGNHFTHLHPKDGQAITLEAFTTSLNVSNIIIEGNTFYNISDSTDSPIINLYAATTYVVENVNITGNNFYDNRGVLSHTNYAITTTGVGTIENVNITGNIAEGMLNGFIYMGNATNGNNFNISNNILIDLPYGILADDGDNIQITNNKFVSVGTPIDVNDGDCNYPFIEGNFMYGCTNSGTYAGATNEIIGNNVWHDATYDTSPP